MSDSLLYESELQETLFEYSEKQYGIEDRPKLLRYLFRRYFIVGLDKTKIPRIKKEEFPGNFMKFWLSDLGIPIKERFFVFKGATFSTLVGYGSPLQNIYEDILHQLSTYRILSSKEPHNLEEWKEAKTEVAEWLKEAKRKGTKYTKKEVYPFFLKDQLLKKANQTYHARVQPPTTIPNIQYDELTMTLSEEEVCHRQLLAFHERVTDGELLSETELEKYVIGHLDEIESGLKMVQSQYVLPNGRIDILARDQEGNYVVIELKVEKDTDVVWQKWYYTSEIKKRYNTDNVRFIVVLPQFYEEVIEPLFEDTTPTEVLQFHPVIRRGKLQKAHFSPYRAS